MTLANKELRETVQTNMLLYTLTVEHSMETINLKAVPAHEHATVTLTVNDEHATFDVVPLEVGENTIVITMTSPDGNMKCYTIKVCRLEECMKLEDMVPFNDSVATTISM